MKKKENRKFSRVLITGIAGSGASYLAEYILANRPDIELHGISRWHSTSGNENIRGIASKITVHEADLVDLGSVISALAKAKPDCIFHLASYANVRNSFVTPGVFLNNNITGTLNLFEAVRLLESDPVIQLCSTSEVYGRVEARYVPIDELAPIRPVSPYAVSKAAQDLLGFSYFTSYGMRIIRTRMFTYINPRRSDLFATSFAKQIAWIERSLQDKLLHGNLESVRTIIDVRDAAAAYWEATLRCDYGEAYNIGGTTAIKVGEVLERLIAMSNAKIRTKLDPGLIRPADVTLQIPRIDKFVKKTGWKPGYTLDESLEFLLSYWRREADKALKLRGL